MTQEELDSIPREIRLRVVIGSNMKRLRKEHGMTQQELANHSNHDRVTIAKVETYQRSVSLKMLLDIAKALGETPNALLEGWQNFF